MKRLAAGCLAVMASSLAAGPALAADQILVLDVMINGRPTELLVEFVRRGAHLLTKASELRELGLKISADGDTLVEVDGLPGVTAQIDDLRQEIALTVANDALIPKVYATRQRRALPPVSPATWGLVANYRLSGNYVNGAAGASLDPDLRLSTPLGTLSGAATIVLQSGARTPEVIRGDVTWALSSADKMRTWRVGDLTTGALGWSRAVRLAGVQVASDFATRPDIIPIAQPNFSGQVTVPSTLQVLVNGVSNFSQSLQPGPFELRSLPIPTGTGDVVVALEDATGRRRLISLPYFSSPQLVAPGLASYSLELGLVRKGSGSSGSVYAGWAGSAVVRKGLTDWLTVEAHGEATSRIVMAGGGATVRLGGLGALNLAAAASYARRVGLALGNDGQPIPVSAPVATAQPAAVGGLVATQFEAGSRALSLHLGATMASSTYRDIGTDYGEGVAKYTLNAGISLRMRHLGNFNLNWIGASSIARRPTTPFDTAAGASQLLNAGYTVSFKHDLSIRVTAVRDFAQHTWGVGLNLTKSFGAVQASAGYDHSNGIGSYTFSAFKPAFNPGDFGGSFIDQEGERARRIATLNYRGAVASGSIEAEQSGRAVGIRGTVSGALVLTASGLDFTNSVNDSYALVKTGGIGGIPVLYENRPVGLTRSNGTLMVPYLRGFDSNRLSIDTINLPADVEADHSEMFVRPQSHSGTVVDFGLRRSMAAVVMLQDASGKPLPLGATVRLSTGVDAVVGNDGTVYLTGLAKENALTAELSDGALCRATFAYHAMAGDIPVIGPIPCL